MHKTQEMRVWSLCQENPLEKEMATHSSILAWKIPRTKKPGRLQFTGLQRVRQRVAQTERLSTWAHKLPTEYCVTIKMNEDHFSILIESDHQGILQSKKKNHEETIMYFLLCLLLFSHSVMFNSLPCHGLQHARLPCSSPAQTHVHWVSDAIQPSHPLSSPSPPAFNLSLHQGLF